MADDFYREIILDHYKSPRGHGELTDPTATAEGQNPLCGDEVTMYLKLGADGQTIEDVTFTGHGCAISQASTSMLTELVVGKTAAEVAALTKEEAPLVELMVESGTPLTPVRLKCALLGLGVLKVALNKAAGTPLPEEWAGHDEIDFA
jgi:nitrogen fixation NifU-like protein